ncbi:hypothetical protein [Streptomyces sp. NPDC001815]|uniref:hypothetical protein n=1 Tax=Streptomyces sp. NPDC001815 TaxID=3154526 RepID=UPI0033169083
MRRTPVVRVRGWSWCCWSIADTCYYRPGDSSLLIYRPRKHRKHRGPVRSSRAWTDYRDLVLRPASTESRLGRLVKALGASREGIVAKASAAGGLPTVDNGG